MTNEKYPADWGKRRYRIFKRDGFECRGCGFTPEKEDGSELHAHHVKPISEGGGHGWDNLMTLCEDCHNEVHSSGKKPPLKPVEYYDCKYCECEYTWENGFAPGYCSKYCFTRNKVSTLLNSVEQKKGYCSTCYSYFPRDETNCPSCGAWERHKNQRDVVDLEVSDIDFENLVHAAIHKEEFGEL